MKNIIIILKPDIIERSLNNILKDEIEQKIGEIIESKIVLLTKKDLELFYKEHKDKDYFKPNIVKNMTRDKVEILKVETNLEYKDTTTNKKKIREKYQVDLSNNSVYMTDSENSWTRELTIFEML